jgi:hypothetical protein
VLDNECPYCVVFGRLLISISMTFISAYHRFVFNYNVFPCIQFLELSLVVTEILDILIKHLKVVEMRIIRIVMLCCPLSIKLLTCIAALAI